MRHLRIAGGESQMEVEHFDPTLTGDARNAYSNLMLATRHCNLRKRDYWPSQREAREGFRLLNPCREIDYGEHLFEDPVTHHLIGATRAGRYHIDVCDLNNETFVWERRQRSRFLGLKRESPALLAGSFSEIQEMLDFIAEIVGLLIPEIPIPGERLLTAKDG